MNETHDSSLMIIEIDDKNPEGKDWSDDGDDEMNPEKPTPSPTYFLAFDLLEDTSKKKSIFTSNMENEKEGKLF